MNIESLRRTGSGLFLIALLALASWPGVAATQDDSAQAVVPLNAHMRSHGGGWECDRGYRKANGACAKIEVPPHAFLGSRGSRWDCERGFKKDLHSCLALQMPTNAHLACSGNRWSCDPGYQQQGEVCMEDRR
jgi:hypothetical protein